MRGELIVGREGKRMRDAVLVLVLGITGVGFGAQAAPNKPLPDATVLSNVDGRLIPGDANDTWWFELTANVKTDAGAVPAGMRMRLLPSATLERLIVDVNDRFMPQYRISARVTRYEGTNFLLAIYFLPLSKFKTDEKADATIKPQSTTGDLPVDPELAIPPEILERLKNHRPIRGPLKRSNAGSQVRADYLGRMIVDSVGLIEPVEDGASAVSGFSFTPYALGWNVSPVRYELLPCAVLEQVRQMQRNSMEPIRFNVAGLVTQFKGKPYLLLQRAVPVYNYGNFGR